MQDVPDSSTREASGVARGELPTPALRIRPYAAPDRPAVRQICADTAWLGAPGGDHIPDDWIWAEFWTRYFTDEEPEHTWVVESGPDARVVGYLSGTADVRRAERYALGLLPGIVRHIWRSRLWRTTGPRRALLAMVSSLLRGETRLPHGVATAYPATFHFNLLPEARGAGIGTRLYRTFEDALRRLGAPGLHTQTLDVNAGVARFNERVGLALLSRRPTRAFRHVEPRPINVLTWVKSLRDVADAGG